TLGELTGDVSVNHPLSAFGYKFYQNSTGWAATIDVYKQDELLQSDTICAGEYIEVKDMPGLYVLFRSFYPDYFRDSDGNMMTLSSKLKNPAYVYMLYYGDQMLGMNVLNETNIIKVDDYNIVFRDPENYTLIQVKRDPFEKFTMVGALIMCVAIFLAFYVRAEELWAVKKDHTWEIKGRSVKGGQLFHDALLHEVEKLRGNQ
ncbi:MAG: cytochrome c biogenesis protein ResB, partial [Erysipelotrichaceae bacterium]|nr:cytochrome c biogenesis protein ResB [Erysipelotrichaceae bacterium]